MDPVIQQLEERRRKARQLIQRGNAELAECDRFERFYRQAVAAKESPPQNDPQLTISGVMNATLEPVTLRASATVRTGTLKERILDLLQRHPEGLVSQEILKALRETGDPNLQRTTISPQLSRLAKDEVLVNQGGVWRLPHSSEAKPSVEGLAS